MVIQYVRYVTVFLIVLLFFCPQQSNSQIYGCTDPLATNYNPAATQNDGSCIYATSAVVPTASFQISNNIPETSGMIVWNNRLWTHNDSDDINIYALDTSNGSLLQTYPLNNTRNTDWEDMSQDESYVYIGDFGNNQNGNRKDLKILRIEKSSLLSSSPVIDTIRFSYANQTDFTPTGSDKTDFDCEAFIVSRDSIFVFTKQWISYKTSVYALPKNPGTHTAQLKSTLNVQGLVTGATFLEAQKLVVLCGYNAFLQPFLYLLYDFHGSDFFGGNKRMVQLALPFHQIEGITTTDGLKYYISNEYFSKQPIGTIPQKLHILDLRSLLGLYLQTILSVPDDNFSEHTTVYPIPAHDFLVVASQKNGLKKYVLHNSAGRIVGKGIISEDGVIPLSHLTNGVYWLTIGEIQGKNTKIMKY